MATIAQFVRDYLKAHPGAANGEIAKALNKRGIIISSNYVAKIKTRMKNSATVETAAPPGPIRSRRLPKR